MAQQKPIHAFLIKLSYFILTVYFFLYSTTVTGSIFQSKIVLLGSIGLMIIAFIMNRNWNIYRNVVLYAMVMIMLLTEVFYIVVEKNSFSDFDNILLYGLIFVIAIDAVEVTSLIKISMYTKLVMSVMTLLLFSMHMIKEVVIQRGTDFRHSFGFYHPNSFGYMVMCLTMEYLFLYLKKTNWMILSAITLFNVFIYYLTAARTSFICTMIVILAAFLTKYTPVLKKKAVKFGLLALIPVMFFLSVFLPLTYTPQINLYIVLDRLFSTRLQMGHYYIDHYGSFFGRPFPSVLTIPVPRFTMLLDSAYLRLLIQSGWPIFITVFIGIFYKCSQWAKKDKILEVSIILALLAYSFFERTTNNLFLCASLLILFVGNETSGFLSYKAWTKIQPFFGKQKETVKND